MSKASETQASITAGRMALASWLHKAEDHGTIYYVINSVSRSGMSRRISLATIAPDPRTKKPELLKLWPTLPEALVPAHVLARGGDAWRGMLDVIAKDWGFSWDARAFNVHGAGMDMVFALVDSLASKAGLRGTNGPDYYANKVRREAF